MAELSTSSNSSLASTSSSCSTSSAQESASEDEIILVDKKNTTAKVWKHFGLKKDDNSTIKTSICRLFLHENKRHLVFFLQTKGIY